MESRETNEKTPTTPGMIYNIGRLGDLLRQNVKEWLDTRQEGQTWQNRCGRDFVRFQAIVEDGIEYPRGAAPVWSDTHERAFDFFRRRGLRPFIRFNLAHVFQSLNRRVILNECVDRAKTFLDALARCQPANYWESTLFEVTHSYPMNAANFFDGYAALYDALKSVSPASPVGYRARTGHNDRDLEIFEENLIACKNAGSEPDFISVTIDPTAEGQRRDVQALPTPEIGTRIRFQIEKIRDILNDSGSKSIALYVTDWGSTPTTALSALFSPTPEAGGPAWLLDAVSAFACWSAAPPNTQA